MNVLGIDIGYSNLKLAFGKAGQDLQVLLRPAGAAQQTAWARKFPARRKTTFCA